MEAERDLAGLVLPFAAGVAAVVYAESIFCRYPISLTIIIMLSCGAGLSFLMHPFRKSAETSVRNTLIISTGLTAGMLCGCTATMTYVSSLETYREFRNIGSAMEAAIDGIPFAEAQTNSILKALITGNRSDIPVHITEAFRKSGASHILALSGLHLGIIYGIVYNLLRIVGNTRYATFIRSGITILLCGLYTVATGAGPSITRAFLFILLSETARLTGRHRSTGSSLLASLLIQLALSPTSIKSAGFQLSYAAMAGIAFIFPWLEGLWPDDGKKFNPVRWMWKSAAMSISCQLTTGPLAFIYFGTFPKYFLLTNLMALPLTGIIIPASLLTLALSIIGICPDILLRATEMLVTALSEALNIISSM